MSCHGFRLALLFAALAACEPGAVAPSTTHAPIKGGTPTAGDPAVVALVERVPVCGSAPSVICTGTLVAPRAVLTAAHCVDGAAASSMAVVSGANAQAAPTLIEVAAVYPHPDYDGFAPDLAIVELASPHPSTPLGVRVAAFDATLVGTDVRIVGYGLDDDGTVGVKREGIAVVTELETEAFVIAPNPAMSCGGDSGGPAFTADGDGETVAGVTSFGDAGCAISGTYARVDVYAASFVSPVLAEIAARSPPPARAVPEPGFDYCGGSCETDADCPRATSCVEQRCALTGGDVGVFGDMCAGDDGACGDGVCFSAIGDGACQCFTRCELIPTPPDKGCDCSAGASGASGTSGTPLLACALLALVVRRRRDVRNQS